MTRQYPASPIVGVGAVICLSPTSMVLVRRAHEPLAGRWTLPGGAIDAGETLHAAVKREVAEETGLVVDVGALVDVVDHLEADADGRTLYHFVIVDYLCWPIGGRLAPGSDAADVARAEIGALDQYELTAPTQAVIQRAVELYTAPGRRS